MLAWLFTEYFNASTMLKNCPFLNAFREPVFVHAFFFNVSLTDEILECYGNLPFQGNRKALDINAGKLS
jgi:hypothetical protein